MYDSLDKSYNLLKRSFDDLSEQLKERQEYIEILKGDLKAGGSMVKNEIVVKKVNIAFTPDEREMLMIGIETIIGESKSLNLIKTHMDLLEKMHKVFEEADKVETEDRKWQKK